MPKLRFLPPDDLNPGDHGSYTSTHHKPEGKKSNGGDTEPAVRLQWIDTGHWDNEPCPQREWAIFERVPLRQSTLFSGEAQLENPLSNSCARLRTLSAAIGLAHYPNTAALCISAAKMTNRNCVFGSRRLLGTTAHIRATKGQRIPFCFFSRERRNTRGTGSQRHH